MSWRPDDVLRTIAIVKTNADLARRTIGENPTAEEERWLRAVEGNEKFAERLLKLVVELDRRRGYPEVRDDE